MVVWRRVVADVVSFWVGRGALRGVAAGLSVVSGLALIFLARAARRTTCAPAPRPPASSQSDTTPATTLLRTTISTYAS